MTNHDRNVAQAVFLAALGGTTFGIWQNSTSAGVFAWSCLLLFGGLVLALHEGNN